MILESREVRILAVKFVFPIGSFRKKLIFSQIYSSSLSLRLTSPGDQVVEHVGLAPQPVAHTGLQELQRQLQDKGQPREYCPTLRVFENCQALRAKESPFQAAEFFTCTFSQRGSL